MTGCILSASQSVLNVMSQNCPTVFVPIVVHIKARRSWRWRKSNSAS
jgi:hypothetical protein